MFDFVFGICVGIGFAIFCGQSFLKLKKYIFSLFNKASDEEPKP